MVFEACYQIFYCFFYLILKRSAVYEKNTEVVFGLNISLDTPVSAPELFILEPVVSILDLSFFNLFYKIRVSHIPLFILLSNSG